MNSPADTAKKLFPYIYLLSDKDTLASTEDSGFEAFDCYSPASLRLESDRLKVTKAVETSQPHAITAAAVTSPVPSPARRKSQSLHLPQGRPFREELPPNGSGHCSGGWQWGAAAPAARRNSPAAARRFGRAGSTELMKETSFSKRIQLKKLWN